MVGSASAVDVTDDTISSEISVDDMALNECPSESIQETNAINDDSNDAEIVAEAFEDEKLSDGEPRIEIEFDTYPRSGIYREEVDQWIDIYVYDAPAEDINVKITINNVLEYNYKEHISRYDSWYQANYTFDPNTGQLHIEKLKNLESWTTFSFCIWTNATQVGDATILVEWESNGEKKQISKTIPIEMGEADLVLEKSTNPFYIYHPPHVHLPNPDYNLKDYELLGQTGPDNGNEIKSDMYPYPKAVGDMLVWYVKVTNNGPNIAFDVNVTDTLPDGVILDSYYIYTGSMSSYSLDYNFNDTITYDRETGVFHIPQLLARQYALFAIVANATTPGLKTNVAKVTAETPDPNQTNNEGNASYDVVDGYDVCIDKSAWIDNETMRQNARPHGEHVDYTTPKIKI